MSRRKPGKEGVAVEHGGKRKGRRPPPPPEPPTDPEVDAKALRSAILKGQIDLPGSPITQKVIRIYISSAGSDSSVERDALITRVAPSLRTFGRERGLQVQVIDLKMNTRSQDDTDHRNAELRLQQIEQCQNAPLGVFFVVFLGDKYGERIIPKEVDAEEFEAILSTLNRDQKALVTSWYLLDNNHVPPVYVLQPITENIPFFVDDDRGNRKDAQNEWAVISERLKTILLDGAVKAFSESNEKILQKYFWSDLENDIQHGVLRSKSQANSSIWVHRSISDVEKFKDRPVSSYTDFMDGRLNEQAKEFLETLKNNKLPVSLPKENILHYSVKWDAQGINTKSNKEHKKYIDRLCSDLENKWKQMIVKSLEKSEERELKDSLLEECYHNICHAKKLLSSFADRGRFLDSIGQKLVHQNETGKRHPIILCSPQGMGKSSTLAKLMELVPQWTSNPNTIVVIRFIGLAQPKKTTHQLMTSLCLQLNEILNNEGSDFVPSKDPVELRRQFMQMLREARVPVVLLLDNVHELSDDGAELREWVPAKLPLNVTFIMTCIPVGQCEIVSGLKKLLPSQSFISIPPLDNEDADALISQGLMRAKRALTEEQRILVSRACNGGKMPLHTNIVLEEALKWNSFTPCEDIPPSVEGAMDLVFSRLEQNYGHTLMSRLIGYLTCAKTGLSWIEIEDILSLDDVILNQVFRHNQTSLRRFPMSLLVRIQEDLKSYITELPINDVTVVKWSHDLLKETSTKRYLADENTRKDLHCLLADYFMDKWSGEISKPFKDQNGKEKEAKRYIADQPLFFQVKAGEATPNGRALDELPHHLTLSDREDDLLSRCLTNFSFIFWKLKDTSYDRLLQDYVFAYENGIVHSDISKMMEFLDQAEPALRHEPEQVANQLARRLPAMGARNSTNMTKLYNDACTPSFDCLLTSQEIQVQDQAGGEVISRFKGHEADIEDFDVSKDLSKVLSCGADDLLNVWQINNCRLIQQVDMKENGSHGEERMPNHKCFFCNKDKWAVVIGQDIQIWDLENGALLRRFDVPAADNYQISGYMLKCSTTLITVTANLGAWDVQTGENLCELKLDKPGKPAKYLQLDQLDDQLTGFDNTVVFYRKATRGIQIVEFLESKRNYKKMNILGKKIEQTHRVAMTCSSTGLMAYLFYPLSKQMDAQPVSLGILDLTDIKNISQVFESNNIDIGHQLGSRTAYIFSNGENGFLFSTMTDESSTNIRVWSKTEEKAKNEKASAVKLLTTKHDSIICVRGATTGKVLAAYAKKADEIELNDLEFASDVKTRMDNDQEPEAGLLGDTMSCDQRFLYYLTTDDKIGVWDLAERHTVRLLAARTKVAAISANQEGVSGNDNPPQVILADLLEGKVIHSSLASSWNVPNFNFRVINIGNDTAIFPGPKPHQVTAMKVQTGKTLWSMEVKDTEEIAGLLVSANKGLLLAEVPQTLEQLKEDRENPQERETRLYCFDVQQRRRLPDLKVAARGAMSTSLTETQQAVLTPDGKHYASIVDTEDGVRVAVWDTTNGKRRWINTGEELGEPRSMVYSKVKECLLLSHAPTSGTKGFITAWSLKSASELNRIELDHVAINMSVSNDGAWLAYVAEARKNIVIVHNMKNYARSFSHYADEEISSLLFSRKADFLLVSVKGQRGLTQLCLHNSSQQLADSNSNSIGQNENDVNSVERASLGKLRKENDLFGEYQFVDLSQSGLGDNNA